MEMEWIHHHNPDLVILNDKNQEVERIDLNGFTAAKIECAFRLLETRGSEGDKREGEDQGCVVKNLRWRRNRGGYGSKLWECERCVCSLLRTAWCGKE